jgi:hypothetical protein
MIYHLMIFYDHLIVILHSSYDDLTITQLSCNHLMMILQPYNYLAIILQTSYSHLIIILQSPYDHLKTIL